MRAAGQAFQTLSGTLNATVSGNTITTRGTTAYGQELITTGSGTANATLANNTVGSAQSDAVYGKVSTATGTLCPNAYGNRLTYAGYGFNFSNSGTLNVTQTSATDLLNQNNGASVNGTGSVTSFGVTCP